MPHRVFISFAENDRKFRDALAKHLAPLTMGHSPVLELTDAAQVGFDGDAGAARRALLDAADVVVVLLSADFFSSAECMQIELPLALAKNRDERAPLVPILATHYILEGTAFQGRRVLPAEDRPIGAPSNDRAWTEVVKILREQLPRWPAPRSARAASSGFAGGLPAAARQGPSTAQVAAVAPPPRDTFARLTAEDVRAVADAASQLWLSTASLTAGLPAEVVRHLPDQGTTAEQILSDLFVLNDWGPLPDGTLPLMVWLENGSHLSRLRRQQTTFDAALAKLRAQGATRGAGTPYSPPPIQRAAAPEAPTPPAAPRSPPRAHAATQPALTVPDHVDLKGRRFRDVCEAIADAFPTYSDLARMTRFELGERLENISAPAPLMQVVLSLVEWSETHGRVADLIRGAIEHNPGNPALRQLVLSLGSDSRAS